MVQERILIRVKRSWHNRQVGFGFVSAANQVRAFYTKQGYKLVGESDIRRGDTAHVFYFVK